MRRVFILILACAAALIAQTTENVFLQPDCILPFNLVTVGAALPPTSGFNNRQIGCNIWQIQYAANGFTALTLSLQAAPDNNGMPGTWATMSATAVFGVNPNTSTTGASALLNSFGATFPPWVRVHLDAGTGTGNVIGVAFGFRRAEAIVNGAVAANITQIGGVNVPTTDGSSAVSVWNGTTWDKSFVCTVQAPITLAASGNTQIIPAGVGVLRVCHISFSTTATEDIQFVQGTGTNCATGTANLSGLYKSVQSMAIDFSPNAALRSSANQAICLNQSAAQTLGGIVVYAPAY